MLDMPSGLMMQKRASAGTKHFTTWQLPGSLTTRYSQAPAGTRDVCLCARRTFSASMRKPFSAQISSYVSPSSGLNGLLVRPAVPE